MSGNKYSPKRPPIQLDNSTIQIQLTRGYSAIIDAIDADLAEFKWTSLVCKHTIYAYRNIHIGDKYQNQLLHKVILERMLGRALIKGEETDHVNRNGLINTRENLRPATRTQNNYNHVVRSDSSTGYKGVEYRAHVNRYAAYIRCDGKRKHLGYFSSAEEAYNAYCEAAKELHGEFVNYG